MSEKMMTACGSTMGKPARRPNSMQPSSPTATSGGRAPHPRTHHRGLKARS